MSKHAGLIPDPARSDVAGSVGSDAPAEPATFQLLPGRSPVTASEQPTPQLRWFISRATRWDGDPTQRLQQAWQIVRYRVDGTISGAELEWRDVPVVTE